MFGLFFYYISGVNGIDCEELKINYSPLSTFTRSVYSDTFKSYPAVSYVSHRNFSTYWIPMFLKDLANF